MRKLFRKLSQHASGAGQPLQVAAVCYRVREFSVEFLLVKTSSGKWTFPKGRIEPVLGATASAAREAWEEAGVRGQIDEQHFGFYLDMKRSLAHENKLREIIVASFLLEVRSTVPPDETDRNPTWFTPQQAKKRLQEARSAEYAEQICNIVDTAVQHVMTRTMPFLPGYAVRQKPGRLMGQR